MNTLVVPLLLPLLAAIFGLLLRRHVPLRKPLFLFSSVGQLAAALWIGGQTLQVGHLGLPLGGWAAPYGIILMADTLTAIMLCLSAATTLAATAYSSAEWWSEAEHPFRGPLLQFLTLGINLSFLTGDFFNLFVAFEVMLLSSYALLTLENHGGQARHNLSYVLLNIVGSALFLCAAGFAYGTWGTLNFAQLAERLAAESGSNRVFFFGLFCTGVFGLKAGIFPLYFWLPGSYPTLPIAVSGLFSGMLTKVGVYVLLRLYATILPHDLTELHHLMGWVSVATMIFGVLGAICQNTIRSVLSWHIISQIGYMTLCLGLFSEMAVTACILYITHHIIVKSSLFFIGGAAAQLNQTDDLRHMGGLWKSAPILGLFFLAQALSLAGIPPLSGFWGKYLIVVEGLAQDKIAFVVGSLVASVLTLFSMLKIWLGAFWGEQPEDRSSPFENRSQSFSFWGKAAVCGALVTVSLVIGLGMPFFLEIAQKAALDSMDQRRFIEFVFSLKGK